MTKEMMRGQEITIENQIRTISDLSLLPDQLKTAEDKVESLSKSLEIATVRK
jgi:hypothetical protein